MPLGDSIAIDQINAFLTPHNHGAGRHILDQNVCERAYWGSWLRAFEKSSCSGATPGLTRARQSDPCEVRMSGSARLMAEGSRLPLMAEAVEKVGY